MSLTFLRDEVRTLYWALEKLDAEEGLNEEESPLFKRIAEHIGEPHGYDESEETLVELNRKARELNAKIEKTYGQDRIQLIEEKNRLQKKIEQQRDGS